MSEVQEEKSSNTLKIDTLAFITALENRFKEAQNDTLKYIDIKHNISMQFKEDFKKDWNDRQDKIDEDIKKQNIILANQDKILSKQTNTIANQHRILNELKNRINNLEIAINEKIKALNTKIDDYQKNIDFIKRLSKVSGFLGGVLMFMMSFWEKITNFFKIFK